MLWCKVFVRVLLCLSISSFANLFIFSISLHHSDRSRIFYIVLLRMKYLLSCWREYEEFFTLWSFCFWCCFKIRAVFFFIHFFCAYTTTFHKTNIKIKLHRVFDTKTKKKLKLKKTMFQNNSFQTLSNTLNMICPL